VIAITYHEPKVNEFDFLPGQYAGDDGMRTISGLKPLAARKMAADLRSKGLHVTVEVM
jgi:hypothetical protein